MEALSRQEYPAMLTSLQPAQAVNVLNDRMKRIAKVNTEIADWLQERRKLEEVYIQGLKKLAAKQPPNNQSELGIFTTPWQKIVSGTDTVAQAHQQFITRIEKDVEQPLRDFMSKNREAQSMTTMQGNLASMAKELEEARERSEKLSKKGGKANSMKVDNATSKLESALIQWDTQAPFVFEKLQAVDESRLNHLRDVLTQLQTHESDQIERSRVAAENILNSLLEVDSTLEILSFAQNTTQGKPRLERNRRTTSNAGSTSLPPPPTATTEDNASEHSGRQHDGVSEPKGGLKRFGTMLGRRRQSMHAPSFGRSTSPQKGFTSLGRNTRDGRPTPSPRGSSHNLRDEPPHRENRLSSLAESPTSPASARPEFSRDTTSASLNGGQLIADRISQMPPSTAPNGVYSKELPDLSDVQPPPGPPPSHVNATQRDAEGFSVPAAHNDPISQAQQEAAEEMDQSGFRLDIRKEPIKEADDAEAQAALSNVSNTLRASTMATPSRKVGTVRGRRDVRNTMYIAPPETTVANNIPPSPGVPVAANRAEALAALSAGEQTISDNQSIRSARSLTSNSTVGAANLKHPDMHYPGLNSSIIETVSAYFENGEAKTVSIIGEMALVHNHADSSPFASSGTETIRLDNFAALEAIAPNHAFVDEFSNDRPGEYKINLSVLAKTNVAFRYKVHLDTANLTSHLPLILKPAWKPQGDKLGLVIEYMLNPAFSSESITLNNLILIATYEGARAAGCQTKPTGTHLKEKSIIYWRLGDVTITEAPQKVIARLIGAEGAEPQPGLIEARWEYHGPAGKPLGSGLGISKFDSGKSKEEADPFADESVGGAPSPSIQWVEVETVRKLVSGKYDAKQVVAESSA